MWYSCEAIKLTIYKLPLCKWTRHTCWWYDSSQIHSTVAQLRKDRVTEKGRKTGYFTSGPDFYTGHWERKNTGPYLSQLAARAKPWLTNRLTLGGQSKKKPSIHTHAIDAKC